ncbi:MAG: hypothetical protein JEZ04_01375 [Spirochaetales bacterium]|nr:hypothetical protein [Spirochaetales bacterium]
MNDWKKHLDNGRKCLNNEDFENAQNFFEAALELCPDEDAAAIGEIVFDIGRAFFGLGMRGVAISNMLAALKLGAGEDHTENMMKVLINEYGMPAQKTVELDDKAAFYAVHIMRYLHSKKSGKFGTIAERDMIYELVMEAWTDFRSSETLCGFKTREKINKFREYVIFFPTFSVQDIEENPKDNVYYADFGSDLCFCGSRLPYMWCCGRIKSVEELENGFF